MTPRRVGASCPFALRGFLVLLLMPTLTAWAQNATSPIPECGKAKVHFSNPQYLTTQEGIVVVELPTGWVLDKAKNGPFYFVKNGENYNSARTLMYINVERLEVPFPRAIQNDSESFRTSCQPSTTQDLAKSDLLEQGCESKTQLFSCRRQKNPYVDLATKIVIGGALLNVVLSADNASQISQYRQDYGYVLKHLTMVK